MSIDDDNNRQHSEGDDQTSSRGSLIDLYWDEDHFVKHPDILVLREQVGWSFMLLATLYYFVCKTLSRQK